MATTMTNGLWGLPNPETQSEFYADVVWKRAIAFVIDTVLITIITMLIVPLTAFTAVFFMPVLFMLVNVIYRTATLASRSATPGMRLMAVELRSRTGERLDTGTALAHVILTLIAMSTVILHLITIALMLTNPRGQGLPDMILGTAGINRAAAS